MLFAAMVPVPRFGGCAGTLTTILSAIAPTIGSGPPQWSNTSENCGGALLARRTKKSDPPLQAFPAGTTWSSKMLRAPPGPSKWRRIFTPSLESRSALTFAQPSFPPAGQSAGG